MRADTDVDSYSPDGRIIQIEYAMKAMNLGTTTVACCLKDKILVVSEKKILNKLQITSSIKKNQRLFSNIGLSSGIKGDANKIVDVAREICLNHFRMHHENISLIGLLKYLGNLALQFGEEANKKILGRPFGASILLGSVEKEANLYILDPSGSYHKFKHVAIGAGHDTVGNSLKEEYNENLGFENSLTVLLRNVANVMQEPITEHNVEVMVIGKDNVEFLTEEQISGFVQSL